MPDGRRTAQVNHMTVTMLGASGSGKTTYIIGAYAELINGVQGCYLHTADPDVGMDLLSQLNDLRAGKELPTTPDTPVRYDFVLTTSSTTERTAIDVTDFRGGAAFDWARGKTNDTARLHQRLVETDAILVALDSEHFLDPVTGDRLHRVREATGADRFEDLITKALADRELAGRPAPSIAILLTKSDLIDGRPGSTPRDRDQLEREVRRLMPAAFRPRVHAMVFPVSVSGMAIAPEGELPETTVDLRDIADPVIFAAGWFLRARQNEIGLQRNSEIEASQDAETLLAELTRKHPIIRWFLRGKITEVAAAVEGYRSRIAQLTARWNELGAQSKQVLSRFYSVAGEAAPR